MNYSLFQIHQIALALVEARRHDLDRFCDISLLFAIAVQTLFKFMPSQCNGSCWLKKCATAEVYNGWMVLDGSELT